MRRDLPPSPVNGLVSAWGLYKSDDDQTHSDDLCCLDGCRGGNLARAGPAGLSGPPRFDLFSFAPALRAGRLSVRLSPPGRWRAGFRRVGRRRRPEWAGFDRVVAAGSDSFAERSTLWPSRWPADLFRPWRANRSHPLTRRSPLWPSRPCSAGLLRSRRADGTDPFARRSALWPP